MANFINYVNECADELLRKVTWPTWNELQNSTIVVLVASVIFALVVFVMDYAFGVNSEDSFFKGILGYIYDIFK